MKKLTYIVLILIAAMVGAASCTGRRGGGSATGEYSVAEGMVWNTSYHITFQGPESLRDSIIKEFDRIGQSLNVFDTASLVSRVNMGDSVAVNTDFIKVYMASVKTNKITGGAFDPTLGPLIDAWGFGRGHVASADTARIDSIMQFVGIGKTHIKYDCIVKDDARIRFNFSAIAKGYACDCIGEMLQREGVKNYLVEIGGEIAARGVSPSGIAWRVGVDAPELGAAADSKKTEAVVQLKDMGVATSGNYRNFREENGRLIGHTISARTGRPVLTDVISATVVASTATEADALATSFMALGFDESRKIIDRMNLAAMLVLTDSTMWSSPSFKKIISE